jgi:hypothetical protein
MTQKIAINKCFGGFGLSRKAFLRLRELKQEAAINEPDIGDFYNDGSGPRKSDFSFCDNIKRDDPLLIQVIKEIGDRINGKCASIKVVEIPDNVEWEIMEYGGREWIAEKHETWS